MAIPKVYIPGSEFTPLELNTFQDEYIGSGFEPWMAIIRGRFTITDTGSIQTWHGASLTTGDYYERMTYGTRALDGEWLYAEDYPMSHNGSLRALQCRIGVSVTTAEGIVLGNIFSNACIKQVQANTAGGASTVLYGTALGTFQPGAFTKPNATEVVYGSPFTFPSNGLYSLEITQAVTDVPGSIGEGGAGPAYLEMFLQVRGI